MSNRRALILAGLTWLLGFGAMNLFWFTGNHPSGLPGLYFYRSATWGDGLLLPLLIWALARQSVATDGWRRRVAAASTVAGAAAGALTQVQWLASGTTRLNWTIPTLHHFNAAGWWHAAFLVVFSGVIAGLVARMSISAADWSLTERDRSLALLAILVAGPAFAVLLAVDNGVADFFTLVAVGAGSLSVVFALLIPGRLSYWRLVAALALHAIIGVVAIASLAAGAEARIDPERAIVLVATAVILWHLRIGWMKALAALEVAIAALALLAVPSGVWFVQFAALATVGVLLLATQAMASAAEQRDLQRNWALTRPGLVALPALFLAVTLDLGGSFASMLGGTAMAIFLFPSYWFILALFTNVVEAEEKSALEPENEWNWRTYVVGFAALVILQVFAIAYLPELGSQSTRFAFDGIFWALTATASLAVFAGATRRTTAGSRLVPVLLLAGALFLGISARGGDWREAIALGWLLWVSYWYGAFILNGMIQNLFGLRLRIPSRNQFLAMGAAGSAATFACTISIWSPFVAIDSAKLAAVVASGVTLAVGVLGALAFKAIGRALVGPNPSSYVKNPPLDGVAQDASLILIETLVVTVIPIAGLRSGDATSFLVAVAAAAATVSGYMKWILGNNIRHAGSFAKAAKTDPAQATVAQELELHVRRQNDIALWLGGPFALGYLLAGWTRAQFSGTGDHGALGR